MAKSGMIAWGTVTALLALWILWVVVWGSKTIVARVKDLATPLGAIVAASALAWSHSYVNAGKVNSATDDATIKVELPRVEEKLTTITNRLAAIEASITKFEQTAPTTNKE